MAFAPGPPVRVAVTALPSGTVTFAFTDIEGSTQRWERDRAAMEVAVQRHDAIVRAAIESHRGRVFKTIGDAFCAAFARPEDGVAAMLAVQRALAAEDFSAVDGLRVRAALHTGTADERDDDYFGRTVNRVARLLAIGHGGQVLLSGATADLVQGDLPPRASLRDLGEHRLKDLARPEYVYQLLAPDLPSEFAPLRSLDVLPNNLPRVMTSFVGREAEIAEITALIAESRLVTLVGSGGVGKTRTSLQVAAHLLDGSRDGVWFIELAPLASGEYLVATIAQPMGIALGDGDPLTALVRALTTKRALLVFDNCEHLVAEAARCIAAIVRGCPEIRVLASSRQGLGIAGEMTYRMPSLATPPLDAQDGGATLRAEDALASAAVALFAERARAADPRFALTDQTASTVAQICRRLDGIPLAIELAAARVTILSPKQLHDRLDERFRVLTGGSRDLLPRQQTLRALIDWSHDLLDERERTLLRRLGVFVNSFTLDAATAVASDAQLETLDVFDVLASLVDKSLVLTEPAGDSLRYRLLESTREYARERLAAAGEADQLATRHLHNLRDHFVAANALYEKTANSSALGELLLTELDEVRAALTFAFTGAERLAGLELTASSSAGWQRVGLIAEGFTRADAAAALASDVPWLAAKLWAAASVYAGNLGNLARASDAALQAVVYARETDEANVRALAFGHATFVFASVGRVEEAAMCSAEAPATHDLLVTPRLALLQGRAQLASIRGDYAAASELFEELRVASRRIGDLGREHITTMNLADVEGQRGNVAGAIKLLREMLPSLEGSPEWVLHANALCWLSGYLAVSGDLPGAHSAARQAIRTAAMHQASTASINVAAECIALVAAENGDLPRAARLAEHAARALRAVGHPEYDCGRMARAPLEAILMERLPPDDLCRLRGEGAALSAEAAIALALEEP